jgi:hypothetical protein
VVPPVTDVVICGTSPPTWYTINPGTMVVTWVASTTVVG